MDNECHRGEPVRGQSGNPGAGMKTQSCQRKNPSPLSRETWGPLSCFGGLQMKQVGLREEGIARAPPPLISL